MGKSNHELLQSRSAMLTHAVERAKHWTIENILIPKAYLPTKPALLQGHETHSAAHKVAGNA